MYELLKRTCIHKIDLRIFYRMHHQTHDKFGRHVHHVVFDWRSLKSAQDVNLGINNQTEEPTVSSSRPVKRQDEQKQNSLHSKQLDTLYWQLDSLKQNMMEKQTCLANVSIN